MVRPARPRDAPACQRIYAPFVRDTAVSFEERPPTSEQMAERIAERSRTHAWLVLEDAGDVVGYAYAGPYKERPAYRWTCEVSVYVARAGTVAAPAGSSTPRSWPASPSAATGSRSPA